MKYNAINFTTKGDAFELVTADPFEALEISSALFFPHRYTSIGTGAPFSWGLAVGVLDSLTVGVVSLGGEIALANDELGSYHLRAPVLGRLRSTTWSGDVLASPNSAAIYRPDEKSSLACLDSHTVIWLLKISAPEFERHLSTLLGGSVFDVVDLAPLLDLTTSAGAAFWALTEALRNPLTLSTLSAMPMVSKPYVEMVVSALLLCVEHRYSEQLGTPAKKAARPSVIKAVEQIHSDPQRAWTVATLAAGSFCSVRSLQASFSLELGTSPMRYLAAVRMRCAHNDLMLRSPHQETVSAIATKWGFSHLGRFSAVHKRTYGETPSNTLNRAV
jgi:AraC-like DNA-binding protein